ncbi:unnamed protein product [Rotaria magnacalcarata]|uniref:Uncharacterized protein n=2 Tax=Rotaria magnacalcarata TaxID=392030 RepID=A0A816LZS7_9BILA|nr:unnamed protein product [Rotaria magnacalcarata]
MMVELSFMFIIILGRWILPKGDISHSALSQLLLVYLSLASDILDLLTLFNEQEIQISRPMVHLVLIAFSCCMLQFALNLTATRGRSFHAEFDQSEIEIHQSAPSSELLSPLDSKPIPHRRQFLSRFLSRSKSSSTTRPLASKRKKPLMKINSLSPSTTAINEAESMFHNTDTDRGNEIILNTSHLGDSRISGDRLSINPYPSIASFSSLQVPFSNSSQSLKKLPRKRPLAGNVKFFVLERASKFLRSELWSILVTLTLQDGPFFAVRLIAIIVYHVRSFLTYFFTFKNFLILVFQSYRIAAICFEKDEYEQEFQQKVTKMKHMSMAAKELGIPLNRKI